MGTLRRRDEKDDHHGPHGQRTSPNHRHAARFIERVVQQHLLKTEKEKMKENLFAKAIPQLGREAKSLIRQLDSKNDLTFLRVRTSAHEILIAPDKDYYLCVLQNMSKN